ncbi:hypothetical protein GCM10009122_43680 [Fulvivirga kasyanovii]|uniref:DUF308 domain-containing protein n=1 Tax=Fulvivirga kasyanovii TaxID=396812 RepID=A0ABW9RV98_9BACT|nr:hypothetical protein [Fulvivirga kasyanovii]MTI26910.1 hypothetical protein [Fulvivirga kasyanovii]
MLKLSQVLKINALSSGITGLGLVLFAETAATLFEVQPTAPFIATGIFLMLFASFVYYNAVQNPVKTTQVRLIIILDSLWVLGSALAIFLLYPVVSFLGIALIGGVALWVLAMAILQQKGLTLIGS